MQCLHCEHTLFSAAPTYHIPTKQPTPKTALKHLLYRINGKEHIPLTHTIHTLHFTQNILLFKPHVKLFFVIQ